jgi:hypothetical protein
MSHTPRRVEDYTMPFLVMSGVILFFAFWTIAAIGGFPAVLVSALGIDRLIALFR